MSSTAIEKLRNNWKEETFRTRMPMANSLLTVSKPSSDSLSPTLPESKPISVVLDEQCLTQARVALNNLLTRAKFCK